MGQLLKPTALVVEDDRDQRALVGALLEECELKVVECETAEAAAVAMEHLRDTLVMIFVDVNLAGHMNGVELATLARADAAACQRGADLRRRRAENSGTTPSSCRSRGGRSTCCGSRRACGR